MASLLHRLRDEPPQTIDDLRLLEAWAAISYFTAWRSIELRWKGIGKKPIPPEWRTIGMRQDFLRRRNRHARHPMNAMLKYGYAVLESQARIGIAEVGLDSTIGYLHVCQPGRQALVYDLMPNKQFERTGRQAVLGSNRGWAGSSTAPRSTQLN